jgi:hypothetical protein
MKIKNQSPSVILSRNELLLKKLCLGIYDRYGYDYHHASKELHISVFDMVSIVNIAMIEKAKDQHL